MEPPVCPRCGRPQLNGRICRSCQKRPLPLHAIRAATLYEPPIAKAIHQLKYNGVFALARPLGEILQRGWARWSADLTPVDMVVAIPLHPERERERGYNQAVQLVAAAERPPGWRVNHNALRRTRRTRPQVELSAAERLDNVRGAFVADRALVGAQRVLLLDDVCTTGATLAAAADALLAAGATSVSAYCLARASEQN